MSETKGLASICPGLFVERPENEWVRQQAAEGQWETLEAQCRTAQHLQEIFSRLVAALPGDPKTAGLRSIPRVALVPHHSIPDVAFVPAGPVIDEGGNPTWEVHVDLGVMQMYQSEEISATILGHELAHVLFRFMPLAMESYALESFADLVGLALMARAGYFVTDIEPMAILLGGLNAERGQRLREMVSALHQPTRGQREEAISRVIPGFAPHVSPRYFTGQVFETILEGGWSVLTAPPTYMDSGS